jgi:hypothetical protein
MLAANFKGNADIQNCFSYNQRKNENNFFGLGGTAQKVYFPFSEWWLPNKQQVSPP